MALAVGIAGLAASPAPAIAQVQVATLEELRGELAAKDAVSVIQMSGDVVTGPLMQFGESELAIRTEIPQPAGQPRRFESRRIPLGTIKSIERFRDSSRNGALTGAGIGAGVSLAMFLYAVAVDRNEMDEWAASYLLIGGVNTGIGALVGWIVDSANSKPRIRFDVVPTRTVGSRAAARGVRFQVGYSIQWPF